MFSEKMSTNTNVHGDEPGMTAQRDSAIIRTVALIAATIGVIYTMTGIVGGDATLILQATGPAVVAVFAAWQLQQPTPRVIAVLLIAAIIVVLQVRIVDKPGMSVASLIGLPMIGAAVSTLIRRHRFPFLAVYSALLVGSQIAWFPESGSTTFLLFRILVPVVSFWFITWLLIWTRQNQETEEARHELLFAVLRFRSGKRTIGRSGPGSTVSDRRTSTTSAPTWQIIPKRSCPRPPASS